MAIELQCGGCQGRLLAEVPGTLVACPHCGVHLQVPGAALPEPAVAGVGTDLLSVHVPGTGGEAVPEEVPHDGTTVIDTTATRPAPASEFSVGAGAGMLTAFTIGNEEPTVPDFAGWGAAPPDEPATGGNPGGVASGDEVTVQMPVENLSPMLFGVAPHSEPEPPIAEQPDGVADVAGVQFAGAEPAASDLANGNGAAPAGALRDGPWGAETGGGGPVVAGSAEESSPLPWMSGGAEVVAGFGGGATRSGFSPAETDRADLGGMEGAGFAHGAPVAAGMAGAMEPSLAVAVPEPTLARSTAGGGTAPRTVTISRTVLLSLVSYASLVTLAFLYVGSLAYQQAFRKYQLESLPDLAPPSQKGKKQVSMLHVKSGSAMPPRHTLRLGQTERYGSLRVTPLRVTRGPLEFVHYDAASKEQRPASGPVLKLHLRLENVSADQEFRPLDHKLVYTRDLANDQLTLMANNFVCRVADKSFPQKLVLLYDLPPGSSWDPKGQEIDRELKPGDVFETYLPSHEEGIDALQGPLLWRVHFRKGYNPTSGQGVTTILEVAFDSEQIESEGAEAAASPS